MAPNGQGFRLGEKIGRLTQAQKTISTDLRGVKSEVELLKKSLQSYEKTCDERFSTLQQGIDGIRNPKISLRQIGHAIVKGAGWAGGAAVAFGSVYEIYRLIFHM